MRPDLPEVGSLLPARLASGARRSHSSVMPGLVPGIHALTTSSCDKKDVDARVKPGHDGVLFQPAFFLTAFFAVFSAFFFAGGFAAAFGFLAAVFFGGAPGAISTGAGAADS